MALSAVLASVVLFPGQDSVFTKNLLTVGSTAPSLDVEAISGSLTLNTSKPAVIVFWHLGSRQNDDVFKHLATVHEKYGSKLQILPVNCGDEKDRVSDFLKGIEYKGNSGLVNPERDSLLKDYGVKGYPTTYVLDKGGVVSFRGHKASDSEIDSAIGLVIKD